MTRHLVDDVAVGWDELGSDLLNGAPVQTLTLLTGGEVWPSRTLDHLITPDGSPPVRMTVTETTAADTDLQWGYILHPEGIEVIAVTAYERGPLVDWDTDPLSLISDNPAHWAPGRPAPLADRQPTPAPAPASATPPAAEGAPQRRAARR
ncbi:hypothetical protein AB0G74_22260 [Streptomyces sp. NPDC020875]|uniref:hypothetical protein n=1 Tax=Streptomyces sp. NPDC020875 TaxID=3154898 RepID=UPI0033D9EC6E